MTGFQFFWRSTVSTTGIFAVLGISIGFFSFGWEPETAALVFAVPVLWCLAPSRDAAGALIFGYYALAARGVPPGAAVFFGDLYPQECGYGLWFLATLGLSLPWYVLWPRRKAFWPQFWRLTASITAVAVPPIGTFGWTSPLLAAGWMYPGCRWAGIALYLILCVLTALAMKSRKARIGTVLLAAVSLTLNLRWQDPPPPEDWTAINTHYGRMASGSARFVDPFIRSTDLFDRILAEENARYILLPETIAGMWIRATDQTWRSLRSILRQRGQTVVVGTEVLDERYQYDNTLRFLGSDERPGYRQRMPVPMSMWRPGGGIGTANAYWTDPGILTLADGRTAAGLICYEQFLAWPFLWSMAHGTPDFLIGAGNQWWSRDTSIPAIERQSIRSWARLWGLPVITATNQ